LYRADIKEAVRIFRPVLQGLKVRSETEHPVIYFAGFDELRHLDMDRCSVQVQVADIDTLGLFFFKYTKTGLLRAFIILSRKLYDNPQKAMRELRKIAGVHEFVHFIAFVYAATVTETEYLRSKLFERLQHTVDRLPGNALLTLYNALASEIETNDAVGELTDAHFRLGCEGPTPDYELLFLRFMFSRELFKACFDTEKQIQFKDFYAISEYEKAEQLLNEALREVTEAKDIPVKLAQKQLREWVHVYLRGSAAAMH
jgi:hypothetical protein